MPTIRPQIASPHGSIATTPCPFAVDQVPTGDDAPAEANGAIIAIAAAKTTHKYLGDFMSFAIALISNCAAAGQRLIRGSQKMGMKGITFKPACANPPGEPEAKHFGTCDAGAFDGARVACLRR